MKVLFATKNKSKIERFKSGLEEKGVEILTINDICEPVTVDESGKTCIENALIKARTYAKVSKLPVFAIDDSLYIEGIPLEKQPGVYVRRVNGKELTDSEMIKYYSNLAHEYGKNGKLICKWVYGMAVINNYKEYTYTWSKDDFYIVDKPSNIINQGYPLNSISINKKLNKYFSEITKADKRKVNYDESDVIDFIYKSLLKD